MSLAHWQPMRELENLRRQMDRLFDEWTLPSREFSQALTSEEIAWVPAIELKETDSEIILKAQIPGIEAKDLNVEVSEDRVSISGEHQEEKQTEEKGYFRSEFHYGRFERTISLPAPIKTDGVVSEFKNGLLTLQLPKAEEARRKVVKIDLTK